MATLTIMQVSAAAAPTDPAQWPASPGSDAELTTTPNTIRFAGGDRYATNLTLGLALRGRGDFPFDTSDRTSGNASGLSTANDWWGAASCPRSIIVVAGDTFADALAAASLSDPLDRSQQPRLQRVAAADPLFDPVGGFDRPDTAYAPVVVTTSARSGATSLAPTARLTASDLAKGGCTAAREALIVGGDRAVPKGVESELIGLGYDEVFRVAGADRYDTAARVAVALGTQAPASGDTCLDANSADGSTRLGFYGNAVPEYRHDALSCRLLSRSVVLAEGGTGADALAAGWWTSRWQVPILLTSPDGSLPSATRTALQAMDIDTVIVLGGVGRIPESTVAQSQQIATAAVGRIAGADRTETSIEMAKAFGGWRPTGDGNDFAGDVVCVTASSGSGAQSVGWPDALAAGPLCARLTAVGDGGPDRALPPLARATGAEPRVGDSQSAHDALPIILVPSGAEAPPASVQSFLNAIFVRSTKWCTGTVAAACADPGFAVVIGGASVIGAGLVDDLDSYVSPATGGAAGDGSPRIDSAFVTELDLSENFLGISGSGTSLCAGSGTLHDARWLSVTADVERRVFRSQADLLSLGVYARGASAPVCTPLSTAGTTVFTPVSLAGHPGASLRWPGSTSAARLTGRIVQPTASSADATMWHTEGAPTDPVDLQIEGHSDRVVDATLDLQLTLAGDGSHGVVTGTCSVTTLSGALSCAISAVARRDGTGWTLSGQVDVPSTGLRGGFVADIPLTDGDLTWRIDGFSPPSVVSG